MIIWTRLFIFIFRLAALLAALVCYVEGFFAFGEFRYARCGLFALASAVCLVLYLVSRQKGRYLGMRLKKVDTLSGQGFEEYLEAHFQTLGYKVRMTEASSDYGADLILKKRRKTIAVQAKRYNKAVGVAAVQEVAGAIAYYGTDGGMVVTNGTFTRNAKKLAESGGIELWDRESLKKEFHARE